MSFPIEEEESLGLMEVLAEIFADLDAVKEHVVDGDRAKTIAALMAVRRRTDALYQGMIRDLVQRVSNSGKVDPLTLDQTTRTLLGIS